ncbi:hypothetical protein BP6252_11631 [Coleophoma cylindrospora]|uniref:NACHT domain-containing protein n=1 Tax=Coleophoma cylindrospora TaxID=1849047 RepID=A0A3D8QKE8_9HELO|nr:hypothetical protein BP6252_11631 [Coleophoma cylindrospora]
MAENRRILKHNDYTVGWICALPDTELVVAGAMLDEEHPMLTADPQDTNSYLLGRIGSHNVVIACLPAAKTGTVSAAVVASNMLRSFKAVRIGLMVGIGGGAPLYKTRVSREAEDEESEDEDEDEDEEEDNDETRDIRLGDVVVSLPSKTSQAVVQYDFGKSIQGGAFVRTSTLNNPPNVVLNALSQLRASHARKGDTISHHLEQMTSRYPAMQQKFKYPGLDKDRCFKSDIVHVEGKKTCKTCCGPNNVNLVERKARANTSPKFHYGTIGSANNVLKDSVLRDQWARKENILCFEMEAAGLMDNFPCLVIRGICDYADSHKSKIWQPYAAATAAAYAKEFLAFITPQCILDQKTIIQVSDPDLLREVAYINASLKDQAEKQDVRYKSDRERTCHRAFKLSNYEGFKNINRKKVPGTCRWVLDHPQYQQWVESQKDNLLWISADPGCGKSVLSRALIENEFRSTTPYSICYFFFKDNEQQDKLAVALCALLHQIFSDQPQLLKYAMPAWEKSGEKLSNETDELWRIFISAATSPESHTITCVLDALDECQDYDRGKVINYLADFYNSSLSKAPRGSFVKFLVTSRPYDHIEVGFGRGIPQHLPTIRLSGERENDKIHEEIDLVIRAEVATLATDIPLSNLAAKALEQALLGLENRTYLWLFLAIGSIRETYNDAEWPDSVSIDSLRLPSSIDDAYEKILSNITDTQKAKATIILHIIVGARRPLTLNEMAVALSVANDPDQQCFKVDEVNRLERRIRRLCGLFVFVNHSKIYLIHQTAKEFLVQKETETSHGYWKHCLKPFHTETVLARICVDYLCLRDLDTVKALPRYQVRNPGDRPLQSYSDTSDPINNAEGCQRSNVNALLDYAAEHWPNHIRESTPISEQLLVKVNSLYQQDLHRFSLWFCIYWQAQTSYEDQPDMDAIILAAFTGHDFTLRDLLNVENIDLEIRDSEGRTALYWAASRGYESTVRLLLDSHANVNAQGSPYGSALQAASARGHETIVKLLLDNHADVNAKGGPYGSALQAASAEGHEAIVKLLLDAGKVEVDTKDKYGMTPLSYASEKGYKSIIQLLLDTGKAEVNARNKSGTTPLLHATKNGHDSAVRALLATSRVEVNTKDSKSRVPLSYAAERGYTSLVQLLLDSGKVEADAKDKEGTTPLSYAANRGHASIVQLLLDSGKVEADVKDKEGATPLSYAAERGHTSVVQLLLDSGKVDVDAKDEYDKTPLSYAAENGHESVVQVLLDTGKVEINAMENNGRSPLSWAADYGHVSVVQLLLDTGNVEINALDNTGLSPLSLAASNGHESVIQLLMSRGADLDMENTNGWTALQLAVLYGQDNAERLLVRLGASIPEDWLGLEQLFS